MRIFIKDGEWGFQFLAIALFICLLFPISAVGAQPNGPTITVALPQNTTYSINDVSLNVSASETIDTWWYSLDGGANVTFTPNTTLTELSNGQHSVVVYANDSAGNVGHSFMILDEKPTEVWNRTIELGNSDNGRAVAVDHSGNVIIAGYTNNGVDTDFLTAKYDSNGNELWNKTFNIGQDAAYGVVADSSGNVIVTGSSDNGISQNYRTVKYDPTGELLWNKTYTGGKIAYAATVDSDDNIIITGDYDNGANWDFVTIKYNSSGDLVWNRTYNSGGQDYARGVAVDSNDNIVVAGHPHNGANYDYFVIKYDSNGNELWNQTFDYSDEIAEGVAVDSSNNILVTGYNNIKDYLTVKYDENGNYLWNRTFDLGSDDEAYGIDVDLQNNAYITGRSNGTNWDYLTVKYDEGGTLIWNKTFDSGDKDEAWGVAIDSSGSVVIGGESYNGGDYDYFTIKYSQPTGPVYFTVYTTPPTITIDSPTNTTYTTSSIDLNVSASETIDTWWYSLDGGANVTFTPNTTLTGLGNGQHSVVVYANDSAGNVGSGGAEVGVIELWNRTYDGGSSDDAQGIAVGTSGNVYVTGDSYLGGDADYYTIKYDSSGSIVWNKSYDGGDQDWARGVAVDASGNVYVTGYSTLGGNWDYYTVKYDENGTELWNRTYDGGSTDDAQGVAVDGSGNVYVTGYSTLGGNYDYYTIKYNSSGNVLWNQTYDGGSNDDAYSVAVDGSNNVYVTGRSGDDYYTIKYHENGTELWNRTHDGGSDDRAYGVAVDSSGNVYVTGNSSLGGNADYHTIKYDSSGNVLWNATYDSGSADVANGVAVDSSGNVYVTGYSYRSGNRDYYIIKYNSSGNVLWNATYDGGSDDYARGVAVDTSGNVYVTGFSYLSGNYDYHTIKYSQETGAVYFTVNVTLDTTPPTITFVSPTDSGGATLTTRDYTFINITLSESGTVWLYWNGTNESMSGSGTNWYLNKTSLTNGDYTYKVYANDSVGNENVSETRTVEILYGAITFIINTTSNGSIKKNLTFESSGDKTLYLKIPKSAIITSATIDITGLNASDFNGNFEWGNLANWTVVERPDDCAVDTVCTDDYVSSENDTEYFAKATSDTSYNGFYSAEIGFVNDGRHIKADASIDLRKEIGILNTSSNLSFYNKFGGSSDNAFDFYVIILNGTDNEIRDKAVSPGNEVTLLSRPKTSALPTQWTYESYDLTPYVNQNVTIIFRAKNTFYACWPCQRWDLIGANMPSWFLDNISITPYIPSNYYLTTSPTLDVGDDVDMEWSYTGDFNKSVTTSDFSEELNNYLSTHTADTGGDILVPLVFNSSSAGNLMVTNISITFIDPTPPIITNITAIPSLLQRETQTIFTTALDNTTWLDSVKVIVTDPSGSNGTLVASLYSGGSENGTYKVDYSNTNQTGNYSVTVQAIDAANNSINSAPYIFEVLPDTVEPNITNIQFYDNILVNGYQNIRADVADNVRVSHVELSIINPDLQESVVNMSLYSGTTTSGSWRYYFYPNMSGDYTFQINATDVNSNHNSSLNSFTVVSLIVIHSPQNTTYNTNNVPLKVSTSTSVNTWWYVLDDGANVTFEPNITMTGLSDGPHNIIVYANNNGSDVNSSNRIYFTIDTSSTPPPSGGGGAGKGVGFIIKKILGGEGGVAHFDPTESPISEITVLTKNTIYNVYISVEEFDKKPYPSMPDPPGKAFKYMKITKSKIRDSDIEEVEIKFQVDVEWLVENDVDLETVSLNRYKNGKWEELDTDLLDADSEYANFSATTPGFSHFSIIGEAGSGYNVQALEEPVITLPPTEMPVLMEEIDENLEEMRKQTALMEKQLEEMERQSRMLEVISRIVEGIQNMIKTILNFFGMGKS